MPAFAPKPSFRGADPFERISAALDEPFSLGRNLWEQTQQGFLDSYGAGTIARDIAIPQGNTYRGAGYSTIPMIGPVLEGVKAAVELTRPEQASMSADEYKASPYFRDSIPWEPGMTEDRAAALADFWDLKTVRQHFAEKRPISSFFGQLAGQALDPINYVPFTGEVMATAAVARAGSVFGRALVSASDAVLNTAAFSLATRNIREKFGDDVSWQAIGVEIAMSAVIGGVFGAGVGALARRSDARMRLDTVKNQKAALIPLNEAIDTLATDGDVKLSPNGVDPVQRMVDEGGAANARPATTPEVSRARAEQAPLPNVAQAAPVESVGKAVPSEQPGLVTPPDAIISPVATGATFKTAKGSTYAVNSDGSTTRDKSYHPEHGKGDQGPQPASEATFYVTMDHAQELGLFQTQGGPKKAVVVSPDGFAGVRYVDGPGVGKIERRTYQAIKRQPEVGLIPVETWKGGTRVHFGNPITEVSGAELLPADPSIAAAPTQRLSAGVPVIDPIPEGLDTAAARVGKPEAMKELADQHGVNMTTGEFPEQFDIDTMRADGKLTAEDEALLTAADEDYSTAEAYSNILKSAVSCLLRFL